MPFDLEFPPRPRPLPRARVGTLDALVAALARLEALKLDLAIDAAAADTNEREKHVEI